MPDLAMELRHLETADREIVAAEERFSSDLLNLEKLRRMGAATAPAEAYLHQSEQILADWHRHRDAILDAIHRARRGES